MRAQFAVERFNQVASDQEHLLAPESFLGPFVRKTPILIIWVRTEFRAERQVFAAVGGADHALPFSRTLSRSSPPAAMSAPGREASPSRTAAPGIARSAAAHGGSPGSRVPAAGESDDGWGVPAGRQAFDPSAAWPGASAPTAGSTRAEVTSGPSAF